MSSNTHEQFIFSDNHDWLNGYDIINYEDGSIFVPETTSLLVFAFYTQKRNEIFVVEWNFKKN